MAILRLLGCGFRRPAEALTSHYLLQEGVELSFESVLRHRLVPPQRQEQRRPTRVRRVCGYNSVVVGIPAWLPGITPTLAVFQRIFERRRRHQLATAMSDEVVLHPAVPVDHIAVRSRHDTEGVAVMSRHTTSSWREPLSPRAEQATSDPVPAAATTVGRSGIG